MLRISFRIKIRFVSFRPWFQTSVRFVAFSLVPRRFFFFSACVVFGCTYAAGLPAGLSCLSSLSRFSLLLGLFFFFLLSISFCSSLYLSCLFSFPLLFFFSSWRLSSLIFRAVESTTIFYRSSGNNAPCREGPRMNMKGEQKQAALFALPLFVGEGIKGDNSCRAWIGQ